MCRRVPVTIVETLEQVRERVAAAPAPVIMIFDADNTVVRWGAPTEEFAKQVNRTIDRFTAVPTVERVIVVTNGRRRGVDRMISRGNKPWTSRRRLGLRSPESEVWVVGDQVLTDGILAWRLGGRFVQLAIAETGGPGGGAVLRALGRAVSRLMLRESAAP